MWSVESFRWIFYFLILCGDIFVWVLLPYWERRDSISRQNERAICANNLAGTKAEIYGHRASWVLFGQLCVESDVGNSSIDNRWMAYCISSHRWIIYTFIFSPFVFDHVHAFHVSCAVHDRNWLYRGYRQSGIDCVPQEIFIEDGCEPVVEYANACILSRLTTRHFWSKKYDPTFEWAR